MTLYQSKLVWDFLSPILAIIQFPWRFISFSLLGLAFLATYFWQTINVPEVILNLVQDLIGKQIPKQVWNDIKNLIIVLIIFVALAISSKYFYSKPINKAAFENKYLSQEYIERVAAYKIAEYLPKTADYQTWRTGVDFNYLLPIETRETNYQLIKNRPFEKIIQVNPGFVKINIHYFPFWQISIDGKIIIPDKFDQLGRPILSINKPSLIKISYQQTLIESISNLITILTFITLLAVIENKTLWKKITV